MMHELPGLNNYKANITDTTYGLLATDIGQPGQVPLNAGFYHRWYQYSVKGAMGDSVNMIFFPYHFLLLRTYGILYRQIFT